jgi:CubicO group peptidase (beta-lactamase class C family)
MNQQKLEQAIRFAETHEVGWSRDTSGTWGVHQDEAPPWNTLLGPVHERGPVSGTLLLDGRTLASWGEPERADLTFSVAKTYLALLAGVAHDRGLIPDIDEPVGARVHGIGFEKGRNAEVTWTQLLQQTSEWEGEVFGLPDQVERYRYVSYQGARPAGKKGEARPLQAPGSYWEYNDVRINALSLALLHIFRRPLPDVFRDAIMRPIGASDGWRWAGYDNAWITLDGQRMQSVPGGTHWGGGVSISSFDQARIGWLLLNDGRMDGRQVLSAGWVERMRAPCAIAPFYGSLVWLNHRRALFPGVPESSWFAFGAGGNYTWIEPERRMVLVVRWLDPDHADRFFSRVLAAVDDAR